jgi:hypothetical protein
VAVLSRLHQLEDRFSPFGRSRTMLTGASFRRLSGESSTRPELTGAEERGQDEYV